MTAPSADQARRDKKRPMPEILAPAGDPEALRAAIAAGADAVYLGMARFNARGRAERFRGVTLAACVRAAHAHGLRVHVTLNTLLQDDELPVALELAREAREVGADAVIVQDLGLAALLREHLPELELHASTQLTIHQADQAETLVRALGFRRIIAARECSAEEIEALTARLEPLGAEVEVFVHGALCYAYSGQCLMSNFAGRRSANRGICAQNCRFDWTAEKVEIPATFQPLPTISPPRFNRREATQLLSMKDLAAFESVPRLASAGVASFKIEGRLKGPEYVAQVVRLYREALDAWRSGRAPAGAEALRAAQKVYSRGFTNGYLAGGCDPSMRGDKRSLEGEPDVVVRRADRRNGALLLVPRAGHVIRPGQGYRYAHDRYRGGFLVLEARSVEGAEVEARVRFGAEAAGRRHRRGATGRRRPPPPLPPGLPCQMNHDPELAGRVSRLVEGVTLSLEPEPVATRWSVQGAPGRPLRVTAVTADGRRGEVSSPGPLGTATSRPLTAESLAEHLGRLGGTGYRLESLEAVGLEPGGYLGFPALHALRREVVTCLDRARPTGGPPARAPRNEAPPRRTCRTLLAVAAGSPGAALGALAAGAEILLLDAPELRAEGLAAAGPWREVVRRAPAAYLRLPAISHEPSAGHAALAAAQDLGTGLLCNHFAQLAAARALGLPAAADVHLNTSNGAASGVLLAEGATRVALSLELDANEAVRAADHSPAGLAVEVVVGGRVYSMLTRQDHGLGPGERLLATSEHGHSYVFEAEGGVTTLHEARELVGAAALPILVGRVEAVRLDLAHHAPDAAAQIVAAYRSALDALQAGSARAQGSPGDPITRALEDSARLHTSLAPHGAFPGHLLRGARALDGAAE